MEGEKGGRLGEVTLTSGLWLSKYECGGQAEPCQTLKSKVSCELHKCIYICGSRGTNASFLRFGLMQGSVASDTLRSREMQNKSPMGFLS